MDDHKSKRKSSLSRSISQKTPFSQKHSSSSSGLSRSSSQKIPSTKSGNSSSQRYSEFTRMAKEQKSKFYIVKRCITMLVSWKKHDDSWETRSCERGRSFSRNVVILVSINMSYRIAPALLFLFEIPSVARLRSLASVSIAWEMDQISLGSL